MDSLLDVIADKHAEEDTLLRAIQQLGAPEEPPRFWIDIANSNEYSTRHRRYAVVQLFTRHVKPGMMLSEFARILNGSKWLDDKDIRVVEDLSGYIPVNLTFDNTVFVLRVLPDLLPAEYWAIYLSVSGHIDCDNFLRLRRGEEVDQETRDAVILEIAFSPADVTAMKG